jgi:hypothetical protein
MVDLLTLALAGAALGGAVGAILLAVIEWFVLKSARDQIEDERKKIEHLRELVEKLGRLVEGLEKQARIEDEVLKVQRDALAIQKEQAEWAQKGFFAKIGIQYKRWQEERKEKRRARGGHW